MIGNILSVKNEKEANDSQFEYYQSLKHPKTTKGAANLIGSN